MLIIIFSALAGASTSVEAIVGLLNACVAELRESGAPVTGELLHSVGDHADVAPHCWTGPLRWTRARS